MAGKSRQRTNQNKQSVNQQNSRKYQMSATEDLNQTVNAHITKTHIDKLAEAGGIKERSSKAKLGRIINSVGITVPTIAETTLGNRLTFKKLEELQEYEDRAFKELRKGKTTLEEISHDIARERQRLEIPDEDVDMGPVSLQSPKGWRQGSTHPEGTLPTQGPSKQQGDWNPTSKRHMVEGRPDGGSLFSPQGFLITRPPISVEAQEELRDGSGGSGVVEIALQGDSRMLFEMSQEDETMRPTVMIMEVTNPLRKNAQTIAKEVAEAFDTFAGVKSNNQYGKEDPNSCSGKVVVTLSYSTEAEKIQALEVSGIPFNGHHVYPVDPNKPIQMRIDRERPSIEYQRIKITRDGLEILVTTTAEASRWDGKQKDHPSHLCQSQRQQEELDWQRVADKQLVYNFSRADIKRIEKSLTRHGFKKKTEDTTNDQDHRRRRNHQPSQHWDDGWTMPGQTLSPTTPSSITNTLETQIRELVKKVISEEKTNVMENLVNSRIAEELEEWKNEFVWERDEKLAEEGEKLDKMKEEETHPRSSPLSKWMEAVDKAISRMEENQLRTDQNIERIDRNIDRLEVETGVAQGVVFDSNEEAMEIEDEDAEVTTPNALKLGRTKNE
ncbi:hypothetical protein BDR26DRAFT_981778 [Obelidium mucronatum]|nr:hypothetical protein BDR26DRAFT_981778 [Obelidium mucronatum]